MRDHQGSRIPSACNPFANKSTFSLFSTMAYKKGSRPFTGAWIETTPWPTIPPTRLSPLHGGVDRNAASSCGMETTNRRPFTGAWIETRPGSHRGVGRWSPLHGGVDRNQRDLPRRLCDASRPFTGAWIETGSTRIFPVGFPAAPSRGRGSKPFGVGQWRGEQRRPFTGAWIETHRERETGRDRNGRPFTGAWIETRVNERAQSLIVSPLHGGVDRNYYWNFEASGSWHVAPSRGRGSKLSHPLMRIRNARSPLHGGVDRNAQKR